MGCFQIGKKNAPTQCSEMSKPKGHIFCHIDIAMYDNHDLSSAMYITVIEAAKVGTDFDKLIFCKLQLSSSLFCISSGPLYPPKLVIRTAPLLVDEQVCINASTDYNYMLNIRAFMF